MVVAVYLASVCLLVVAFVAALLALLLCALALLAGCGPPAAETPTTQTPVQRDQSVLDGLKAAALTEFGGTIKGGVDARSAPGLADLLDSQLDMLREVTDTAPRRRRYNFSMVLAPGTYVYSLELLDVPWPIVPVSTVTRPGLDARGARTFAALGVMRIYTKQPGKDADRARPFTLPIGATVADLAMTIHNDIAATLEFARVWGHGAFDGHPAGETHVLQDGDVVELHAIVVQLPLCTGGTCTALCTP